jgi:hypothetical protein
MKQDRDRLWEELLTDLPVLPLVIVVVVRGCSPCFCFAWRYTVVRRHRSHRCVGDSYSNNLYIYVQCEKLIFHVNAHTNTQYNAHTPAPPLPPPPKRQQQHHTRASEQISSVEHVIVARLAHPISRARASRASCSHTTCGVQFSINFCGFFCTFCLRLIFVVVVCFGCGMWVWMCVCSVTSSGVGSSASGTRSRAA